MPIKKQICCVRTHTHIYSYANYSPFNISIRLIIDRLAYLCSFFDAFEMYRNQCIDTAMPVLYFTCEHKQTSIYLNCNKIYQPPEINLQKHLYQTEN